MRLMKMSSKHDPVAGQLAQKETSRFRRTAAVLSLLPMVAGVSVLAAPAASAAALTNASWTVSNNQVSSTNVTYTYSFKTATAGTIKFISFVVSGAGLGGASPTVPKNYGIGAGTVARAGQTITYTVTSAVAVAAGIPIYIEISGLSNSSTVASYTTAITTQTNVPATIDTVTSPAVLLAASNTAVTVTIAKSATFTIDTTAFTLAMDPSLPALADQSQTVALTVATNANSGYTLSVADNAAGLQSASTGTPVIADVSVNKAGAVVWPGADKFGYNVTATGATADPFFAGSKYAGYVGAGEVVATHGAPTAGDTITITNRVAIDYLAPATDFTDTITYTMTPSFT